MTSKTINQTPYLRTSRSFPQESQSLSVEIDKSYIDIANAVNTRTIGIFPTIRPAVTGESWYLDGGNRRRQSLRQAYLVTGVGTYPHGINFSTIFSFSRMYGDFTNGTNWYGLIAASNVPIAGQVSFYLDPVNINVIAGAGAPTVTSGQIVLEWISQV